MKMEKVFIGNIMVCTKQKSVTTFSCDTIVNDHSIGVESFDYIERENELYKENAILVKIQDGGYVDIDKLNSIFDYVKIDSYLSVQGFRLGGLMMPTYSYGKGTLFVDENSLRPYYEVQKSEEPKFITTGLVRKLRTKNN